MYAVIVFSITLMADEWATGKGAARGGGDLGDDVGLFVYVICLCYTFLLHLCFVFVCVCFLHMYIMSIIVTHITTLHIINKYTVSRKQEWA